MWPLLLVANANYDSLLWTQGVRASEIAKAIENAYKKCMHRSQREEEGMILKHKKRQKETDEETDDINPPKRRIAAGRRRIMTRPLSPSCKHRVMETKLASMETLALNHGTDPQAVSAELTYRQCQDDQDVADVDGVTRRQFQAMTRENTRGQSESCGDEDPLKELMERFLRTRLAKSITFR
jgi:hypothetical protein